MITEMSDTIADDDRGGEGESLGELVDRREGLVGVDLGDDRPLQPVGAEDNGAYAAIVLPPR